MQIIKVLGMQFGFYEMDSAPVLPPGIIVAWAVGTACLSCLAGAQPWLWPHSALPPGSVAPGLAHCTHSVSISIFLDSHLVITSTWPPSTPPAP